MQMAPIFGSENARPAKVERHKDDGMDNFDMDIEPDDIEVSGYRYGTGRSAESRPCRFDEPEIHAIHDMWLRSFASSLTLLQREGF